MSRIAMTTPLVELDGDEMTRVIWAWVKELLIEPYVELRSEYFDLGLPARERSRDQVTDDAAAAISRLGVGVKCATITPNAERVEEYGLSEMYKSPNATIRALLDGTVFRTPIIAEGIGAYLPGWTQPITIARHAYGDVYKNVELSISGELAGARVELLATTPAGVEHRVLIHDFSGGDSGSDGAGLGSSDGAGLGSSGDSDSSSGSDSGGDSDSSGREGVIQGTHNRDDSIRSFARSCFAFALEARRDLWFGTKDTISKTYDRRFRDIFAEVYETDYRERFAEAGIAYYSMLIDDAVARVVRSEGGFVWACKNYDGDVMSDMVATAFGSLAMMTSVLVSPEGAWEYEAAHGTVQRHYYRHLAGEPTSTNPVATLFAWTGALRKRGELDGLGDLVAFADRLEAATLATIAAGTMTGDLYVLSNLPEKRQVDTRAFLEAVAERL